MRNLLRLNGTAGSELSQEYAEFEGLYRELLQRHEAEDRSQTELVFSGPEAQALRWVADHSKKLNLGTLPGFSLP